jgi:hypothetical protein
VQILPPKARQAYRRQAPYPPPPHSPSSSTTRQAQLHIFYACVSYTSGCVDSTEANRRPGPGEGIPSARGAVRLDAGYYGQRLQLEMCASFPPELHRLWRPRYLRARPPAHSLQGLRRRESLRARYPHPSICCSFHRHPHWFWARGGIVAGKLRASCLQCAEMGKGGGSICSHGRQRFWCKDCRGQSVGKAVGPPSPLPSPLPSVQIRDIPVGTMVTPGGRADIPTTALAEFQKICMGD